MNDVIRLAIDMACENYDKSNKDGAFTSAGLANAIRKLSDTNGLMDGRLVRVILAGRPDVQILIGGSHYKRI